MPAPRPRERGKENVTLCALKKSSQVFFFFGKDKVLVLGWFCGAKSEFSIIILLIIRVHDIFHRLSIVVSNYGCFCGGSVLVLGVVSSYPVSLCGRSRWLMLGIPTSYWDHHREGRTHIPRQARQLAHGFGAFGRQGRQDSQKEEGKRVEALAALGFGVFMKTKVAM